MNLDNISTQALEDELWKRNNIKRFNEYNTIPTKVLPYTFTKKLMIIIT